MKSKRTLKRALIYVITALIVLSVYLTWQSNSIYGGDAGDFAASIKVIGIPHPPGYPFYTLVGVIITRILNFGSIAWRIGLLSSLSSFIALIFLLDSFVYLTKRKVPSVIVVLTVAFLYPIWLYSEVVEVFALNNLFIVLLIWFLVRWSWERKKKYLYLFSFFFGLSLTHHQIIIFLAPSLLYLLIKRKKELVKINLFLCFLLFILGLTPYLYPIIASFSNPQVNWMGEPNITSFFQLVTRAGYGTFVAGSFIAHEPVLRLINIFAFLDFVYKDFRIAGILLFFLGAIYMFRRQKDIFLSLIIAFFSYLFFLFYASFPLTQNFLVGTFERFVQPLYIIMSYFLVFGLVFLIDFLKLFLEKKLNPKKAKVVVKLVMLIFLIYPVGMFILNFSKISILKADFTAENLGRDILGSVPDECILILSTDTPLFNTQYVYYSKNDWRNVKLIHFTKLFFPYYESNIKKHYPLINYPGKSDDHRKYFQSFLDTNYDKYPIFSKMPFSVSDGVWIPWGLLFRYYKDEDIPDKEFVFEENEKLWEFYQDPLESSLSKYQNLMLSDNLRIYAGARQEIGYWLAKNGLGKHAEKHLIEAERLYPEELATYVFLAQVYIEQEKCDQAQKQIEYILAKNQDDEEALYLQTINYAVCFKDLDKAKYYQKLYEEKKKGKETKLEHL